MEENRTKRILIIGAAYNGEDAVSNILSDLCETMPDGYDFYMFGYKNEVSGNTGNCRIHDLSVLPPYKKHNLLSFFYRAKRRICHFFKIESYNITEMYAYQSLKKKSRNNHYDLVIGVSGYFCFIEAAYRFSKAQNIPLKCIYFDPFVENLTAYNHKKRIKSEKKWVEYAKKVYYNEEMEPPSIIYDNFSLFKIPISLPLKTQDSTQNDSSNELIYGGSFYKSRRQPDVLFNLSEVLNKTKYHIICFSNIKSNNNKDNISFNPIVDRKTFLERCKKAKGLIYIGNIGSNQISSKYIDYISLKKPIIGINVEKNNEVRKYPFFIEFNGNNIADELDNVDEEALAQYDPLKKDFTDRNILKAATELFNE